jgi:hypothetical protein
MRGVALGAGCGGEHRLRWVQGTVRVGDGVRGYGADMEAGGKMYTGDGRAYCIDGEGRTLNWKVQVWDGRNY